MEQENKPSRKALWIAAIVALLGASLILGNWEAFRAGLRGDPAPSKTDR